MPGVPYQDSVAISADEQSSQDSNTSIIGALRHFENSVDMMRMSGVSPSYCEQVRLINIQFIIPTTISGVEEDSGFEKNPIGKSSIDRKKIKSPKLNLNL